MDVIHLRGLDIRVAKELMPRALKFMDTLIKALHARGHTVEISNDNTLVVINGEEIRIYFLEKLKRVMVKHGSWESSEPQGNGTLFFWMKRNYRGKEWRDGKQSIEEQLSNIMASLEIEGARLKKQREEREIYWAQQREKERIIREARERKEKEEQDFKDLLRQATRWRETNLLEQQAVATHTFTDELKNKISWAWNKANDCGAAN